MTSPPALRTRSTGTVHASNLEGSPLCPIPATTAMDATDEAVTCRRCLTLAPVEEQVTDLHGPEARASSEGQGHDVPALEGWTTKTVVQVPAEEPQLSEGERIVPPTVDCQPWCTDHDDCTLGGLINAGPDDGICQARTTSPAFGEVLTSYTKDHGPMVNLYNTLDELIPAAAKELAQAILAQVAEIDPASGIADTTPDEEFFTRDAVRISFYKGVIQGATAPNATVDDLKAAATDTIVGILDERCQHERAVQEEPLALFASGYAACLRAVTKASERLDVTTPEIHEFIEETLTVKERERVGRLVAATLRLRTAKTATR